LGSSYPFLVDDTFIVTKKSVDDSVYIQLLFLTSGGGVSTAGAVWNLEKASKLFEDIVENALKTFFGQNTKTVNFGFPSRSGRPPEFPAAVEWLSKKTNIRLGNAYRPPRKKDGGVDLFVWKSFSDNKPGIPIMLVQCTIKDDFINGEQIQYLCDLTIITKDILNFHNSLKKDINYILLENYIEDLDDHSILDSKYKIIFDIIHLYCKKQI
jgi:hypothetical protein